MVFQGVLMKTTNHFTYFDNAKYFGSFQVFANCRIFVDYNIK